ncbi:hypothetical protein D1953_04520 [Peribacillus asahii]|uniref:YitT family protein n=1 Tax=Peribacillus asahii TaxID=228899 RepID=A0A398BEK3_9BACI|nr:hypothetical protein [Peribacillus asahii]RID88227.1 hypothetical protein D1953_04520 [Peribacillus asahii]
MKIRFSLKEGTMFFIGLIIIALGSIHMIKASDLGVQPFDVLYIAINQLTSISIGKISILTGSVLLIISFLISKEKKLKIGTILDTVFLGTFVDLFLYLDFIPVPETLLLKISYLSIGTIFISFGAAMTIYSKLGAGPIDTFMLSIHTRFNILVKKATTMIEITALLVGMLLGGPVGIGTIIFCISVGPLIEVSLKILHSLNGGFLKKLNPQD